MGYGAPPRGAIAQLFLFKKPSVIQVKVCCILIEEYSHFNFYIDKVLIAITRVWCRKSFSFLFEITIF